MPGSRLPLSLPRHGRPRSRLVLRAFQTSIRCAIFPAIHGLPIRKGWGFRGVRRALTSKCACLRWWRRVHSVQSPRAAHRPRSKYWRGAGKSMRIVNGSLHWA